MQLLASCLDLARLPDDVEVQRFADHRQIIPESRVVVTHGGAGTVQDALLMGRPMVVLPQFADQFFNAEQVVETVVGVTLVGEDQTSDRIAAALRDVLAGGYDAAVQRIATEADEMPSLADGVQQLEALVRSR